MIRPGIHRDRPGRAGITLTEILIGIMILGVGLVSIATLFPIGLLRLREAQRMSRSALLFESAAADMAARNLVAAQSFQEADLYNTYYGLPTWYPASITLKSPGGVFNPLLQDAPAYGADPFDADNPGLDTTNPLFHVRGSAGLPFAYDPLWRYRMNMYQHDVDAGGNVVPEARYGSGIGFVRNDPNGGLPSAHGLQRLTNFNGRVRGTFRRGGVDYPIFVQQSTNSVPSIFVSPEDVVWNERDNPANLSPILPDRTLSGDGTSVNDWRFTWMFTGRLTSSSNSANFDGDLVIYENRPFSLDPTPSPLDPSTTILKPADETVVEAVFGYSRTVSVPMGGAPVGYGRASDRSVLLRWPASMPDPVVKPGDWICDVTYERQQLVAASRFVGVPNQMNGFKWDNMPAQRAYWYQVVKVSPAVDDPGFSGDDGPYRRITVQVASSLRSRTPLVASSGEPAVVNAALIAPHVVNVIPQTFVIH